MSETCTLRVPITTDIKAGCFNSAAGAIRTLGIYDGTTAADDNGAISIWRDGGAYVCQRYRFLVTIDDRRFTKLKDVRTWTKEALELIK